MCESQIMKKSWLQDHIKKQIDISIWTEKHTRTNDTLKCKQRDKKYDMPGPASSVEDRSLRIKFSSGSTFKSHDGIFPSAIK